MDKNDEVSSAIKTRIEFFDAKAESWWDASDSGSMSHLHLVDPFRIQFICDELKTIDNDENKPLQGINILDVGCGAGVLTEKLAHLGAEMTGIDPAEGLINAAKRHASMNSAISDKVEYYPETPEEHFDHHAKRYDAAIVFLLIEHIQNRSEFFESVVKLLKPNGSLLIMHSNRSFINRFFLTFWNPYVIRLYVKNLIHFERLMRTSDLLDLLQTAGRCHLVNKRGMRFYFIGRGACFTSSDQHFNLIHVRKNGI
ncbi:Hexaprenyldihydroxybenzoate methyltransferase, mitochondrial [Chamberlinius hualienensis]